MGIGVGQALGVAGGEGDIMIEQGGVALRFFDQGRRQVKPAQPGTKPCRRNRDDTGAAGEIEHRLTRRDAGEFDQMRRCRRRKGGDWREARPSLPLRRLEIAEWIVGHCLSFPL